MYVGATTEAQARHRLQSTAWTRRSGGRVFWGQDVDSARRGGRKKLRQKGAVREAHTLDAAGVGFLFLAPEKQRDIEWGDCVRVYIRAYNRTCVRLLGCRKCCPVLRCRGAGSIGNNRTEGDDEAAHVLLLLSQQVAYGPGWDVSLRAVAIGL